MYKYDTEIHNLAALKQKQNEKNLVRPHHHGLYINDCM